MPRLIRGRAGHTLPELLVSLVLLGLVALIAMMVVVTAERLLQGAVGRSLARRTLAGAGVFLRHELGELGGDHADRDLVSLGSDSASYRALRGLGLVCQASPTEVRLASSELSGWRGPQALRDSLLLPDRRMLSGDSGGWVAAPVLGVRPSTCPSGAAATAITTLLDSARIDVNLLPPLSPVRLFEVMQIRAYSSGGQLWLGARSLSASEAMQPAFGPLASPGVTLTGLDSAGAPAPAASTRAVDVVLRAPGARWLSLLAPAQPLVDSARDAVVLRNTGP